MFNNNLLLGNICLSKLINPQKNWMTSPSPNNSWVGSSSPVTPKRIQQVLQMDGKWNVCNIFEKTLSFLQQMLALKPL